MLLKTKQFYNKLETKYESFFSDTENYVFVTVRVNKVETTYKASHYWKIHLENISIEKDEVMSNQTPI